MPRADDSAFAEIGRRVRSSRIAAGLTQEQVAHHADVNPSYYGKLERGLNNPTASTLIRVAAAVGVDPGGLIAGLGPESLPGKTVWPLRGPRVGS